MKRPTGLFLSLGAVLWLTACGHTYAPQFPPTTVQHAPESLVDMRLCVTADVEDREGFVVTMAKAFRDAGITVVSTENEPCDFRVVVHGYEYEGDRYWEATLRPWEDRIDIGTGAGDNHNYQTNTWVARYRGDRAGQPSWPLAPPAPPPPSAVETAAQGREPKAPWDTLLPVQTLLHVTHMKGGAREPCGGLWEVMVPRQKVATLPDDYDQRVAAHYVNAFVSCEPLADLEQWLASQHLRAVDALVAKAKEQRAAEAAQAQRKAEEGRARTADCIQVTARQEQEDCESSCGHRADVSRCVRGLQSCRQLAHGPEDSAICNGGFQDCLTQEGVTTANFNRCVQVCGEDAGRAACGG